ncbi:MAG: hypothetical protein M1838_002453 [Thelocarpon superellum]|nr:MAG: hypothetical protein M1838_002453 [Thelocarpon superellum]
MVSPSSSPQIEPEANSSDLSELSSGMFGSGQPSSAETADKSTPTKSAAKKGRRKSSSSTTVKSRGKKAAAKKRGKVSSSDSVSSEPSSFSPLTHPSKRAKTEQEIELCKWRTPIHPTALPLAATRPTHSHPLYSLLASGVPPTSNANTSISHQHPILISTMSQLTQSDHYNLAHSGRAFFDLLRGDVARRQTLREASVAGPCNADLRPLHLHGAFERDVERIEKMPLPHLNVTQRCQRCGEDTCGNCTVPNTPWVHEARVGLALRFLCVTHATQHRERIQKGELVATCSCAMRRPFFCAPCEVYLTEQDQKYALAQIKPGGRTTERGSTSPNRLKVAVSCLCGTRSRVNRNVFCDMCGGETMDPVEFTSA